MKFEKVNDNKIKITLNMDDLKANDIDFHSFMSNSGETESFFLAVLDKAERDYGFSTDNYNLKVETIALDSGSFILTITRSLDKVHSPAKKRFKVSRKSPSSSFHSLIYQFANFEDFCQFAESLSSMNLYDVDKISKVSMLYPMSILNGENAKTEYTGITFAGGGQDLDTGFKVIHNAPNTSSVVNSKSISKDGGACTYRALVRINENAKNSKCSVSCESLMLDDISRSDTIPVNDIRTDEVEFSHEAKIGKISDKAIFYLMSRGLSEEDAKAMIVRGFAYPISKELPVEYAVEMNNLINLELEGAIG